MDLTLISSAKIGEHEKSCMKTVLVYYKMPMALGWHVVCYFSWVCRGLHAFRLSTPSPAPQRDNRWRALLFCDLYIKPLHPFLMLTANGNSQVDAYNPNTGSRRCDYWTSSPLFCVHWPASPINTVSCTRYHPQFPVGNLPRTSLNSLWKGTDVRERRTNVLETHDLSWKQIMSECRSRRHRSSPLS